MWKLSQSVTSFLCDETFLAIFAPFCNYHFPFFLSLALIRLNVLLAQTMTPPGRRYKRLR